MRWRKKYVVSNSRNTFSTLNEPEMKWGEREREKQKNNTVVTRDSIAYVVLLDTSTWMCIIRTFKWSLANVIFLSLFFFFFFFDSFRFVCLVFILFSPLIPSLWLSFSFLLHFDWILFFYLCRGCLFEIVVVSLYIFFGLLHQTILFLFFFPSFRFLSFDFDGLICSQMRVFRIVEMLILCIFFNWNVLLCDSLFVDIAFFLHCIAFTCFLLFHFNRRFGRSYFCIFFHQFFFSDCNFELLKLFLLLLLRRRRWKVVHATLKPAHRW